MSGGGRDGDIYLHHLGKSHPALGWHELRTDEVIIVEIIIKNTSPLASLILGVAYWDNMH